MGFNDTVKLPNDFEENFDNYIGVNITGESDMAYDFNWELVEVFFDN